MCCTSCLRSAHIGCTAALSLPPRIHRQPASGSMPLLPDSLPSLHSALLPSSPTRSSPMAPCLLFQSLPSSSLLPPPTHSPPPTPGPPRSTARRSPKSTGRSTPTSTTSQISSPLRRTLLSPIAGISPRSRALCLHPSAFLSIPTCRSHMPGSLCCSSAPVLLRSPSLSLPTPRPALLLLFLPLPPLPLPPCLSNSSVIVSRSSYFFSVRFHSTTN